MTKITHHFKHTMFDKTEVVGRKGTASNNNKKTHHHLFAFSLFDRFILVLFDDFSLGVFEIFASTEFYHFLVLFSSFFSVFFLIEIIFFSFLG